MAIDDHTCPVCGTEGQPTWFKEVTDMSGRVIRRIPRDYACPNDCINRVTTDEYNAALRQRDQHRAGQTGPTADYGD